MGLGELDGHLNGGELLLLIKCVEIGELGPQGIIRVNGLKINKKSKM